MCRCFYLSKQVEQHARQNPEEKEECDEIIQEFKDLPVQLFDQCIDTKEAQIILEDQTGVSKFFRYPNDMLLPRLQLAIEHNYKCFVGHPLCQQVFRKYFHQDMPWHGKPLKFQILHIFLQIVSAPFMVIVCTFIWIGKYVSEKRGINTNEPSLFGIKKWSTSSPSWHRKCFNGIIDYTTQKQLKLDVPVNRMIIFTGYYFIFAMFLACLILDKSLKHNRYCFSEWHSILTIYALSMIWQDLVSFLNVRSFWTFFKFWRTYDLVLHIGLALALILRMLKATSDICSGCELETCKGTLNDTTSWNATMESELPKFMNVVDDYEDCVLSLVSILAIGR